MHWFCNFMLWNSLIKFWNCLKTNSEVTYKSTSNNILIVFWWLALKILSTPQFCIETAVRNNIKAESRSSILICSLKFQSGMRKCNWKPLPLVLSADKFAKYEDNHFHHTARVQLSSHHFRVSVFVHTLILHVR